MTKSVKNLLRKLKRTETKLTMLKSRMRLKRCNKPLLIQEKPKYSRQYQKMKKRNLSFRKRRSKRFKRNTPIIIREINYNYIIAINNCHN